MTQTVKNTLEDIVRYSTDSKDKIFLVEVKVDWNGCSHINAPVITKIENDFKGIIELYRVDLKDNKNSSIETCFETTPSVLFIKDGIVIKTLTGTFSRKSIEKILAELINSSDK
jgi:thioredoxin-like negative regulator of GroEL